jgi:hypothetical protein
MPRFLITHQAVRRCAMLVLVALGVFGVAGIARAYFSTGSAASSGVAPVGGALGLTSTPVLVTTGLYPGGASDLSLIVRNANASPIHIGSLALDTTRGTGGFASDQAACTVPALAYSAQTNSAAGWTVPAQASGTPGQLSIRLTGALTMGTSAGSACQGATFTVYLVAN